MDLDQIKAHEAFPGRWYYSIELAPGLWTDGAGHKNVALTRQLLSNVDVEAGAPDGSPARCLDVGMQEGLVTMLLERRGGSPVVGYDRVSREQRFDLLRSALDARFQFIGGMPLSALPRALEAHGHRFFDVVVFSGVLYHMLDPVAGLATVRGLVRNGGILIVESRLAFSDEPALYLNSEERFGEMAIWLISVPCLDYLLRLLRLEVLDVAYLAPRKRSDSVTSTGRVAVACRAVAEPPAEPGDEWITWRGWRRELTEFINWNELTDSKRPVDYRSSRPDLVRGPGGSVDLRATVESMSPNVAEPDQIRLAMDAQH